jgi:pimeloyl-ACP methyl ester carboxylesterase
MPILADMYYSLYQEEDVGTPPVVLVHGAGGTHLYWPPEVRRLKGYRVYALDLPGHGKSSDRDGRQTIGEYARCILEWMEAVGIPRAIFIGHSMGGAIVQALGIHHPMYVMGLGLVSTGVRLRVHPVLLENAANGTTFHRAIETLLAFSFGPGAPTRLVELAGQRMNEVRPSVLYGDLLACDSFDVMEHVTAIQRPTLVICGSQDQMTPLRYAQFLVSAIPGARLEIIPDAGHMVMLEQPQAVASALSAFLASIPYRPGEE